MSQSVKPITRKTLKQGVQQYYDRYFLATELYNVVLYDKQYDLLEKALTYHMNTLNDLKKTFKLLELIVERVDLNDLEKRIFKTKSERLILDNYYALQDLRELYKEFETQFYTLKTVSLMVSDDNDKNK